MSSLMDDVPAEVKSLIVTKAQLPRLVKCGSVTFKDNTPFCIFPNLVYDFAPCAVNVVKEFDDLVDENGEFSPYSKTEVAVSEKSNNVKRRESDMLTINAHGMPESYFSLLLPLPSDGNKTGQDFLLAGQEKAKIFWRTLAKARQRRAKTQTEVKHAAWMTVNYGAWPPTALEVQANEQYRAELSPLEKQMFSNYCRDLEVYFQFIESHMLAMFKSKPTDFQMKMKPLKSPGTDRTYSDGLPFNKEDACYFPTKEFDVLGDGKYDPKNAYCKQTFYPLKKELSNAIIPRMNERFTGLINGKRGDPDWEAQMKALGCARESVIAWRINNPDELKFVKNVRKDKAVWDVETEELVVGQEFGAVDDDDWWDRLQGKPRELFLRLKDGVKILFVSPYQVAQTFKSKFDKWVEAGHTSIIKGKTVIRRIYPKFGAWLRARIIMPARWTLNMYDGTVIKPYILPLEHSKRGFPNPKTDSPYQLFIKKELSVGFDSVVPWATDVSHFETFYGSNPWLQDMWGPSKSARGEYFRDAACGFIATRQGAHYHTEQTSSGIGHTTGHSLFTGCFIASVDIGYRSVDPVEVSRSNWRSLIAEGIQWAIDEYKLAASNPFSMYLSNPVVYHPVEKPSATIKELSTEGSDDQGGHSCAMGMTRDEVIHNHLNKRAEEWRKKTHSSIEFDIGSHFGIIRTPDGVELDKTASDWKIGLAEHKVIGDLLAAGMFLTLRDDESGLQEDFQEALDAIDGGDWHSYEKGYILSLHICRNAPDFYADLLATLDPEYSNSGRRFSKLLEDSGFKIGSSLALSEELTESILKHYLDFIQKARIK